MLELTRVFFFFLIQQIAAVIFGLARAKILAALTGVAGFGLISQANAFILTLQVIFGVGLGSGFIKLIAESRKDADAGRLNQVLAAVFSIGIVSGTAGLLLTGLASSQVSAWIFGDARYSGYILVCAAAALFVFLTQFLLSLKRGLLEWRFYSLAVTLGYAASLGLTVALVAWLNVDGGVWALLASQVANFAVALYFFWSRVRPRHPLDFRQARPSAAVMRLLLANIGPLVALQVVTSLGGLALRSLVVQRLGIEQNGLYQLPAGISDAYMGLILGILMSYVLPKITAAIPHDPAVANQVQNNGLRLCMLVMAPFLVALLAAREIWIPILYSPAFLAAGGLLAWQLLGDFFLVLRRCLNVDLIPSNRFGYFLFDGLAAVALTIGLSAALLPALGLTAVVAAGLAANLLLFLLGAAYHYRRTAFRASRENLRTLILAFLLVGAGFAAAAWITDLPLRALACAAVLALMAAFLPQRGELAGLGRAALGFARGFLRTRKEG